MIRVVIDTNVLVLALLTSGGLPEAVIRKENDFENFDRTMRDLMSVSHDDIKAALDADKLEK